MVTSCNLKLHEVIQRPLINQPLESQLQYIMAPIYTSQQAHSKDSPLVSFPTFFSKVFQYYCPGKCHSWEWGFHPMTIWLLCLVMATPTTALSDGSDKRDFFKELLHCITTTTLSCKLWRKNGIFCPAQRILCNGFCEWNADELRNKKREEAYFQFISFPGWIFLVGQNFQTAERRFILALPGIAYDDLSLWVNFMQQIKRLEAIFHTLGFSKYLCFCYSCINLVHLGTNKAALTVTPLKTPVLFKTIQYKCD